jgi:rRNA processing protein Krr1/Pno1
MSSEDQGVFGTGFGPEVLIGVAVGGAVLLWTIFGPADAPAVGVAAGVDAPSKKKKKKKSKSKSGEEKAVAPEPTPTPAAVEEPSTTKEKPKKKKKNKTAKSGKGEAETQKSAAKPKEVPKTKVKPAAPLPLSEEWAPSPNARNDDGGGWSSVKTVAKKPRAAKPEAGAADAASTKTVVKIDPKLTGIIVGPKGATLYKLQDETLTKINIPTFDRDDRSIREIGITVEGPADGVKRCAMAIKDLATKRMCSITHGELTEGSVQVHPDNLSTIIGPGGSTIKVLQEKTGCNVVIPSDTNPHKKLVYVKIIGQKDDVAKVKAAIKTLMKYYHVDWVHPGVTHVELSTPTSQWNLIIGHRGQTIKSIQGNTKAKIYIPNKDSSFQKVLIVGRPDQVAAAQQQVAKAIDKGVEQASANDAAANDDWGDDYDNYDPDDFDPRDPANW